jgi:GDPmannose 4,6-dehydratase
MNSIALIFGSEGQDGLLLSKYLKELGFHVYGVSHHVISANSYLDGYFQFDLSKTSPFKLKTIVLELNPSEIYYLAAFHSSSEGIESVQEEVILKSLSVNYINFQSICSICLMHLPNIRIVYTSSSLIYSNSGVSFCNEKTPIVPGCFYSLHKSFSGDLAKFYRSVHRMHVSIAIMFNHESMNRKKTFLSKNLIAQVKKFVCGETKEITVGDLNAVSDWGYAGDYVRGLVHINHLSYSDDFIIASGVGHKVVDWFYILEKHIGIELISAVVEDKGKLGRKKPNLIGDNFKLIETGWKPEVNFDQMVTKLYDGLI